MKEEKKPFDFEAFAKHPAEDLKAGKPVERDLNKIYKSLNADMAAHQLKEAEKIWVDKFAIVFKSWHRNWDRLTNFFKYPPALRRVIYTTNPIESYHRMVRKITIPKDAYTPEDAIVKQIYLATMNAQPKWRGISFAWASIRRDLSDYYKTRFNNTDTIDCTLPTSRERKLNI